MDCVACGSAAVTERPERTARGYRLTLRDLAEMFLVRGIVFNHEAVREWEAKLAPVLADELRQRHHGRGGSRGCHWHVDETYLKIRAPDQRVQEQ